VGSSPAERATPWFDSGGQRDILWEILQQSRRFLQVYLRSWLWDTSQLAASYARRWWGERSLFLRQPLRLLL
jgi:hypothetical protein